MIIACQEQKLGVLNCLHCLDKQDDLECACENYSSCNGDTHYLKFNGPGELKWDKFTIDSAKVS